MTVLEIKILNWGLNVSALWSERLNATVIQ